MPGGAGVGYGKAQYQAAASPMGNPELRLALVVLTAIAPLQVVLAAKTVAETINETPCLFEYRIWQLEFRRSPVFLAPQGFTDEQCDAAKLVNEQLGEIGAREAAEDRRRKDAAEAPAKAAAAKRAQAERAAREEFQRRPGVRIGMTADDVINRSNWGAPQQRNRTTTAKGTREQWVYGIRQYLYLDDGRVTAIQD